MCEFESVKISEIKFVDRIVNADLIFFPFAFDGTSYNPGSRFGARQIIKEGRLDYIGISGLKLLLQSKHRIKKTIDLRFFLEEVFEPIDTNDITELLPKRLKSLLKVHKPILSLGGEHTISYYILKGMSSILELKKINLIIFDAHLDLTNPANPKPTHGCWLRRFEEESENIKKDILVIGARDFLMNEIQYAQERKIKIIPSWLLNERFIKTKKIILNTVSQMKKNKGVFYLSLDLDVLDPSFFPAVSEQASFGITPSIVADLLGSIINKCGFQFVGFDLVEYNPLMDDKNNSLEVASKLITDILWAYANI